MLPVFMLTSALASVAFLEIKIYSRVVFLVSLRWRGIKMDYIL